MARRSRNISRGRSRSQKGGNYTSGASYGTYVNDNGPAQFARTFDLSGPYGARVGSEYVGAQGQWAQPQSTPSAQQLALIQSAGRRRSAARTRSATRSRMASRGRAASRGRSRRGGLWGEVLNQAIVPFGILGMQQTFRRKKHGGKTYKRRH